MIKFHLNSRINPSLRPEVMALQPELVAWRRHIHQCPELGFQEYKTSAFICHWLEEWRIPYRAGVAQTGVVATIEGANEGSVLAIRADMDALPIREENETPYCSTYPQVMHACGHDGHIAIALGTAKILQDTRHQWDGTVKIIFQPAEENPGGAKPMIEAGILQDPDVEAMLGLHLWNNLPLGSIGVKEGPSMAYADRFEVQILGKGGHGAMPQQTVDALLVGAEVVSALQTIVSRNVDPMQPAVVSIGQFRSGDTFNVIPQTADILGTIRSFDPEIASLIPQRIEQIIAGLCQAYGASYRFKHTRNYPAVNNHPHMATIVARAARQVLGSQANIVSEMTMGGEDMSFFLEEVPGCYFFLGSANPALGLAFPHHHPRFDFDETALGIGVEVFLRSLEEYRQDPISH